MLSNLGEGVGFGGGVEGNWLRGSGGLGRVGEEKQQEERDKCGKVHQSSQWFISHPPNTLSTHLSLSSVTLRNVLISNYLTIAVSQIQRQICWIKRGNVIQSIIKSIRPSNLTRPSGLFCLI